MKPRYARGSGQAPTHLSYIRRERLSIGTFVFSDSSVQKQVSFVTHAEFLDLLRKLMAASVPLSVGGHCSGPADEVAMLIAEGELNGSYIEISWSGPGQWVVREIVKSATEWEQVSSPSLFANTSFNPDALKRAG